MWFNIGLFFRNILYEIGLIITDINRFEVAAYFLVFISLFLFGELFSGRRMNAAVSAVFIAFASAYFTFVAVITLLGRAELDYGGKEYFLSTFEQLMGGSAGALHSMIYNIMLFIPVGIIVSRYRSIIFSVAVTLSAPFIIEYLQQATCRGVFEPADIVCNIVGGALGILITELIIRRLIRYLRQRKGGIVERKT